MAKMSSCHERDIPNFPGGGPNLLLDVGRPIPDPRGLEQQQPARDTPSGRHLFGVAKNDETTSQMEIKTYLVVRLSLLVISEHYVTFSFNL